MQQKMAIDKEGQYGTVAVINHTKEEYGFYPGEIIADFQPKVFQEVCDEKQNPYLFEDFNKHVYTKALETEPLEYQAGETKVWMTDIPKLNNIPVGLWIRQKGAPDRNGATEVRRVHLLTIEEQSAFVERNYCW